MSRRAAVGGGGRRAAERSTHIKDSVTSVVSEQKLRWKEFVDRKRFSAANRNARKALIKHANKDQVNAVSEIVMNLLKNNVPVTPVTMARLRPYKQILRQIGNRAVSLKKRRQALINQKGGKLWNGLTTVVKTCCR